MRLLTYWGSATSCRVRGSLDLKGIADEAVPVDQVVGEQNADNDTALNQGRSVPTLVLDDGTALTRIEARCPPLPTFDLVRPENHPDAN